MREQSNNRRHEMPQHRHIRKSDKSSADNGAEGRSVPDVIITLRLIIVTPYADAPLATHSVDT